MSGAIFGTNATYFFQQVGVNTAATYKLNLGSTALALVATLVSWFAFMPYFGRRTIYLWGMAAMATIMITIGILNIHAGNYTVGIAQSALCLVWTFFYQASVGQLGWALPAEVGSSRLRQKTVCLARNAYYIVNVVAGVLEPYFMNPTAWDLKGYTGFIWGATALGTLAWVFFRLPETRGRTVEGIDVLFARGVPTRQFATYQIDGVDESSS